MGSEPNWSEPRPARSEPELEPAEPELSAQQPNRTDPNQELPVIMDTGCSAGCSYDFQSKSTFPIEVSVPLQLSIPPMPVKVTCSSPPNLPIPHISMATATVSLQNGLRNYLGPTATILYSWGYSKNCPCEFVFTSIWGRCCHYFLQRNIFPMSARKERCSAQGDILLNKMMLEHTDFLLELQKTVMLENNTRSSGATICSRIIAKRLIHQAEHVVRGIFCATKMRSPRKNTPRPLKREALGLNV
jgi:hypothetical protein